MHSLAQSKLSQTERAHLQALCDLSDFLERTNIDEITSTARSAPDPETAVRKILTRIRADSPVLQRKWRQIITALWVAAHPKTPALLEVSLTTAEVEASPILKDARAFLEYVAQHPVRLLTEQNETLLDPLEVEALLQHLPSQQGRLDIKVENEWGNPCVRRLRATLQAARLVRPWQGKLIVVRSRYRRWLSASPVVQFYVLWHTETYHVAWDKFAGQWNSFIHVIQDYLPLLWDLAVQAGPKTESNELDWCAQVVDAYEPLWSEQGLLSDTLRVPSLFSLFQRSALPSVLNTLIVQDLFARYGLINNSLSELPFRNVLPISLRHPTAFHWTPLGATLLEAERTCDLPCGLQLLQ